MIKKLRNYSLVFTLVFLLAACTKEQSINEPGNLVPKTVDQDMSLPAISINGTQMHAEAFGPPDSALLIILHGGPGSDYRYLLNCKSFANQGFRVIFYDQRGSGLSKRHPRNSYSVQLMSDDLSAVIAHYRTSLNQKVFLLGHSWGAILASIYINQYPTTISGIVLAEPGGIIWQDIEDYIKRSRTIKFSSELSNDLLYADQFLTGKDTEHAILDYRYSLLQIVEGNKQSPTGDGASLASWRPGAIVNKALIDIGEKERPDWTKNLNQYKTKVLFVYSENNKAYGLSHAQKVSSAFPKVQLLKINGAGHNMISFPTGWNNFYPPTLNYLNSLK
ncbi:alpha/beta fold hydrolase [Pedobacter insulae]|uniref:Proline iminopeptidase n=1 Tax=Pedobacter insulae TaxID=414048 RepID=A0A1I2X1Q2_9SPHI|nr:alpha/beta hydrolase [Pedobacter insulae]SFH05871.1 proline iminopeptidase [Pedobacter insulae]